MPLNRDKFFIYAPVRHGAMKGTRLLGVNHSFKGGANNPSLQDLIDFLKKKEVDLARVEIPSEFKTLVRV